MEPFPLVWMAQREHFLRSDNGFQSDQEMHRRISGDPGVLDWM